jgi:tRNA threonylcarbamoyladenosine biosynthesis protein TsaB
MTHFFSIQGSYKGFSVSLFKGPQFLQTISCTDSKTSGALIPSIETLLHNNNLSLKDISFIAVDQGPGAFTSLRVTITIANSIAFAEKIPLIGIDGLEALAQESLEDLSKQEPFPEILVTLLNAYNNEVFFAIHTINKDGTLNTSIEKNYKKIDLLLDELSSQFQNKKIIFTGNGTDLFKEKILECFGNESLFLTPTIETCSSKHVGIMSYEKWIKKEGIAQSLYPLYLKSQKFHTRKK